jgi:hypothetical protein
MEWRMGLDTGEIKPEKKNNMVQVPLEEYQSLLETKTKLDIITRFVELSAENGYLSALTLEDFNAITNFDIVRKEEEKKK